LLGPGASRSPESGPRVTVESGSIPASIVWKCELAKIQSMRGPPDHPVKKWTVPSLRVPARIPTRWDKYGALRARQLAKRLVRNGADEACVILGWAPGGDAPFLIEASTCQGGLNLQVPRDELPTVEWLTIRSIVRDLELHQREWAADMLAGYFCQASAPWER
jgi:hypothetical protein